MRRVFAASSLAAAALAAFTVATPAWACAVCGQVAERSQFAYIAMTVMMSLTPLVAIGGVIAFVVHRVRRAQREDGGQPPPGSPS